MTLMRFPKILTLLLWFVAWAADAAPNDQRRIPHQVQLRHPGIDSNRLKTHTLYQTRDREGLITGYTMVVDSVVCNETVCEVVGVTIVWDALGQCESYKLEKGTSLEKADLAGKEKFLKGKAASYSAVPFTDADNKKLDQLLKDKYSVLQTLRLSDLTTVRDNDEVDAVTMPTPINVQNAVVEGAALTCFHLWHWANGEVGAAAKKLTHQSCDKKLLSSFLSSNKPHYVLFALDHSRQHKLFSPKLVKQISELMRVAEDKKELDLGFAYLQDAIPVKNQFQEHLGVLFAECSNKGRVQLLGILASKKELPDGLIEEMAQALPAMRNYYELHLFLSLLEKHDYVSQSILTLTARLLEDKNFFIARRAYWYLKKQTVDEQITSRLEAFREESKKQGRILD